MERLPGFRDFYPEPIPSRDAWSASLRQHLFARWRETARRYGFLEYDGPPLETLELFTAKSGDEIVRQLYHFTDKGGREVALRPEMTPTLARMVAGHVRHYKKPIKWFAIPQLFRYERQQKGRLREHFQFNADIFGDETCGADAELIALLIDTLRGLGLTEEDFVIRLSSRDAWQDYFTRNDGDPSNAYAFFQIIDKLDREAPEVSAGALRQLGFSLEKIQEFIESAQPTDQLDRIIANLTARGLRDFVKVDYRIIRGLAYYTGPVFEAFDRKNEFRAIAGGGRYDQLVSLLTGGKVNLPGLGFGMGDVVLSELLKARKKTPLLEPRVDVYCLVEDESVRPDTLRLVQDLRDSGLSVEYPLTPVKQDKQFKRALELGARHTVAVSVAAPADNQTNGIADAGSESKSAMQIRVKDLGTREEQTVSLADALRRLAPASSHDTKP